jgi:hypothetical protein
MPEALQLKPVIEERSDDITGKSAERGWHPVSGCQPGCDTLQGRIRGGRSIRW